VPPAMIKPLILQTHEDIHHQHHIKVLHVLRAAYYWPNMVKDIHEWCTSCAVCTTASVRRKHSKTKFDPIASQAALLPRQHYGIESDISRTPLGAATLLIRPHNLIYTPKFY
jgi:hypothetical protein